MSRFIPTDTPFFKDDGEPNALGTVYFGEPNTDAKTNPKVPYLDAALTSPATATQSLTAGGKLQQKLWLSGDYSVIVDDSDGVQVDEDQNAAIISSTSNKVQDPVADYTALRALDSSDIPDGAVITVTNDGIAGPGVIKTGTVTDNGGTLIVFTDDSNRYWERSYDSGFVYVTWFEPAEDGTTDATSEFESARDATSIGGTIYVPQPQTAYRVESLFPGNRKRWVGVGTRQGPSLLRCTTANTGIFEFTTVAESIFEGLYFDATALGCAAFKDTSGSFSDYMQNCDVINCFFDQSLRYGIFANLILSFIHRCNFMQHGSDLGQDRTAIHSEWNSGAKTVNDNVLSNCNVYNTKGTNGALYILRGFNFEIIECTFEALEGPAIRALGVDNVRMQGGWIENVNDATQAIDAELSTVGTRVFLDGVKIDNNNGTNTFANIVSLDSACSASIDNCNGNINSANLTLKSGVGDAGLLSSQNNNFTNYNGEYSDTAWPQKVIVRSALESFWQRQTSLTDNPGSPETVVTFTIPTTPSGQEGYVSSIDIELSVLAVATSTSVMTFNQQKGRIVIARSKAGTVTASIDTSVYTGVNTTEGGGGWTSAPVWSVNVSGSDVELLMTSNPFGGSYTGGITAVVSGLIHNHDSSGSGTKLITYA